MSAKQQYRDWLLSYVPRPIRSEPEYRRAIACLERIMSPHPTEAESQIIELLSTLVESYESQAHPTPSGSPGKTLRHLLDARSVRSAEVARATGIPAATLSNVLAERRSLSKANSVKLGSYFGVSPALFLAADLAADARRSQSRGRKTTKSAG